MKVEYDEHHDAFIITASRDEAIDLSVLFGMKGVSDWTHANGLPTLSADLHRLLRQYPPLDACEHCITSIVYVEGEWRHTDTCRAYCADGQHRAFPKRLEH